MNDPYAQPGTPLPPPGLAPPTQPVWMFTPPPPKWPIVIGVITAVLSVGTLGSIGLGLVMRFALGGGSFPMMGQAGGAMRLFTGPYWMIEVGLYAASLVGSLVSLMAGLQTVQRRASGRTLHLWGTAIVLAGVVATSAVNFAGMNPALARMGNVAQPMPFWVNSLLALVIGSAYPVFLLIWFGPMRRSPDQGAAGGPGAGWVATSAGWVPERPRV